MLATDLSIEYHEKMNDRERYQKRLLKVAGQAIADYLMIADGDRILVALSGGKDSYVLLLILLELRRRAPVHFELIAANVDPGFVDYNPTPIQSFADQYGVALHLLAAPIQSLIEEQLDSGDLACPLCARMRRGVLYTFAKKMNCNKLALGHHFDDAAETLLMNLFYSGSLRSMPPRYIRDQGPPELIRPLAYALEDDISAYAATLDLPLVSCASPSCNSENQHRQRMKELLSQLAAAHPDIKTQMRKAIANADLRFLYDASAFKD